jgi:hypothetical protein
MFSKFRDNISVFGKFRDNITDSGKFRNSMPALRLGHGAHERMNEGQ